ncbi:hypothetical protein IE077_001732 [Cardiosporidium cionae]|uniref:Uncharacterized protein n=1 Tax=Cardiosporidium cionae TaxID=476202 RepID=A0ABQ7JCG9_9APIC|nr:hypothetical protein IE077_001732 [Cardiosporidium cionae]|eukprot:KAF8821690.1 hypothetical protein IE077_001732 [Cardiosporidium cionae]
MKLNFFVAPQMTSFLWAYLHWILFLGWIYVYCWLYNIVDGLAECGTYNRQHHCLPSKEKRVPPRHIVVIAGAKKLLGLSFLLTCWGFSSISQDNLNYEDFQNPTPFVNVLGVACKNVPLWVRLLHIFNFCQLQVISLDLMLLPECNSQGLQTICGRIVFGKNNIK